MNTEMDLFTRLLSQAPGQPATNFWRAIELAEVIRHGLPSGRGLDLGCGDGRLTSLLLSETGQREMVGIDPDPTEAAQARRMAVYSAVHTADANNIPEPDASFDFIFSNSVLEHVDGIDDVLAEVGRVLKPQGRFLFTVPGPQFHDCLGGPLWGDRTRYLEVLDRRCAHVRYWTVEQWQLHLKPHRLSLGEYSEYLNRKQVRHWERLSNATSGVLYGLAGRRLRPIEIQRKLQLRRAGTRIPRPFAWSLAHVLSGRLLDSSASARGGPYGCLWIDFVKNSNADH